MNAWKDTSRLMGSVILGLIVLAVVCTAFREGPTVFDDAFISYRYARNLAEGSGITWNPGEAPTEGYTNFLLVLFLAPFIRLGLEPLAVTRALGFACAAALGAVLYGVARRRHGASRLAAVLIAALVFVAAPLTELVMLGLETVIYAFVLLGAVLAGARCLEGARLRDSLGFSALVLVAALLRPEALLVYPVFIGLAFLPGAGLQARRTRVVLAGGALLLGGGALYLVWKQLHFGALLPNPFYVKAAGQALVSHSGLESVRAFVRAQGLLLALLFPAWLLTRGAPEAASRGSRSFLWLVAGLLGLQVALFVHTDTLMDYHGRFLFPLVPLLVCAGSGVLALGFGLVEERVRGKPLLALGGCVAYFLVFGPECVPGALRDGARLLRGAPLPGSNGLMAKEYRIAQALAEFPDIRSVRVSSGDAGVMPYFTGAVWLDTIGLNDTFMARTRDRAKLVDYYFQWAPDLAIRGGSTAYAWFDVDLRWDAYEYVGTCRTAGDHYDLHFLLRTNSAHFATLRPFLRSRVVDGWYEDFPLELGTRRPRRWEPAWVAR